ncbi:MULTISPECIES: restriction endonuclease subunit S [Aeromonas]|uniref:restriction endonuclease subunit S n=1 Tax=Aeromonas caviae TaxID=648 RepID=UPI002B256016|nr:restriction endonuclease subunit S [Aeromonas caviae]MEA9433439.1 restriction endonuclease subunit S [Aeromonas caviae]
MNSDWTWVRLGDHCSKIGSGATPTGGKDSYLSSGPFCLIRSQNVYNDGFTPSGLAYISNEQAKKLDGVTVQENDVLLNITGDSVARVCLAEAKYLPARVNQHVAIIRPNPEKLDSRFLRYFLASPFQQDVMLGLAAVGATRNALTKVMIENFKVPCPPIIVQSRIAEILGSLDDRIALLRETNATLEAIAQALFKSWFVDFDPVHANAGTQPPSLPPEIQAQFPDTLTETPQGLAPEGWQWSTIAESFILTMGQSPPGDTYNETGEGLPFYQGRTDYGFRFPAQRVFCNAPTRLAQRGDSLVSVRAPVGDVNIALENCAIGRGVAGVRHPSGCNSFVFYSLKLLKPYFEHFNGEGTVFGSINKKDFQNLPVIDPKKTVLDAFEAVTSGLDAQIENNELKLRTLTSLRDTLLPRLISGQLRLPDAEQAVEEFID